MEIIPLNESHLEELLSLNKTVLQSLIDPLWFIPFSEQTLRFAFENNSMLFIYGAFIDGALIGISLYDTDEGEWGELADVIGREGNKVYAEIGGSMVLPSFRGRNVMYEINKKVAQSAKENGIDVLVATAHPKNEASNRSLQKLGMTQKATIMRSGKYLRKVYELYL